MQTRIYLAAVAALLSSPLAALAQATEAPASAPISVYGWDLTGYVDVGYTHLNRRGAFNATPGGPVTVGGPSRVFDYRRNSLDLHQVAVTLAKQPKEGFGGLLNVTAGRDADVIAAYKTGTQRGDGCNLATGQSNTGSCRKNGFDVTQAFGQYATGPTTVILGKYVTLAGAEVINSPTNTNFSRSILFGYAIPFTHTGVRASYVANDKLTLIGGVNNGWDAFRDTNSAKTGELGLIYAPIKDVSLAAQLYSGRERVGGLINTGPEGKRNLFDVVATFNASEQLAFVVNYDRGTQANAAGVGGTSRARWSGWAGYANYTLNERWKASLRGEYFDDRDGYRTGLAQKWKEATLTVGYLPTKSLELRGEVRGDRSNMPAFVNSDSVGASKTLRSVGVQALYKF